MNHQHGFLEGTGFEHPHAPLPHGPHHPGAQPSPQHQPLPGSPLGAPATAPATYGTVGLVNLAAPQNAPPVCTGVSVPCRITVTNRYGEPREVTVDFHLPAQTPAQLKAAVETLLAMGFNIPVQRPYDRSSGPRADRPGNYGSPHGDRDPRPEDRASPRQNDYPAPRPHRAPYQPY